LETGLRAASAACRICRGERVESQEGSKVVKRFSLTQWKLAVVLALLAPAAVSATNHNHSFPRIDPTGQRLFVCDPPKNPYYTGEPGKPTKHDTCALMLSQEKMIAPVGTEVILLGNVCGKDGLMRTHERIEWMLSPGGVGQLLAINQPSALTAAFERASKQPKKVDNSYAIGTTSSKYVALTRGTPTRADDVLVQKGQAWVSVTSPVEGVSRVTAFAPSVYEWSQRQKTATIYWVDALWAFPPATNNPVGSRSLFTTTVIRQTDRSPLVGWIVRYEIAGGPAAGFSPDGGQVFEAVTNATGQATAEVFQQQPTPGTNLINIQLIRPAELSGGYGQRLVVGVGTTTCSWNGATAVSLRMIGPSQGLVGSTLSYRIEVSNPGNLSARNITVANPLPQGLTYLTSNPPAQTQPPQLTWNLGDLSAGETRVVEVDYRADAAGVVNNCAVLTGGDGATAQSCASTTVMTATAAREQLEITMTGPPTIAVGQEVEFVTVVTNRGTAVTPAMLVVDRFDAGLQHPNRASPIEKDLAPILPGQSQRIVVTLRANQAGKLCNTMELFEGKTLRGTTQACVTAVAPTAPVAPFAARPTVPPATPGMGAPQGLTVNKSGPEHLTVGQRANFVVEIANRGATTLTQVRLLDSYDRALRPEFASPNHTRQGDDVIWVVPSLAPGAKVQFKMQAIASMAIANACNRCVVTSAEGARAEGEACVVIAAAGQQPPVHAPQATAPPAMAPPAAQPPAAQPPAAQQPAAAPPVAQPPAPAAPAGAPELKISIVDLNDPLSVGKETTYEVKVTNIGTAADEQVSVVVATPAETTPIPNKTVSPRADINANFFEKSVRFNPIATLGVGETVTYKICVRADRKGAALCRAEVVSAGTPNGASATQETTIFAE